MAWSKVYVKLTILIVSLKGQLGACVVLEYHQFVVNTFRVRLNLEFSCMNYITRRPEL